jgi:hypothetical protein
MRVYIWCVLPNILPFHILILVTQYSVTHWGMYFFFPIMMGLDDFCRRVTLSRDSEFGEVFFHTFFCKALRGRVLARTNLYFFHRARGLPRAELPRTTILASVRVSVIVPLPILTRWLQFQEHLHFPVLGSSRYGRGT